ncbi:hypothetical protein KZZ52_26800 [Dactylosporangium sp. AC04546]|uniref:hypothetical protein n=1 Tax=Dactylosporangium sp. AC04546 TaxID=2862460 RepID=UPI001EE0189D|nr:hypothetical protein [Dactylosporangium sp. AC04546]WVK88878.1 hypothetical protein KZZ52_26800 [Dactylosporangium sp. AC04546]
MKRSRGRVAALIVATVVLFGAGACGDANGGSSATGASSAPADPKDVLAASTAAYDKGNYAAEFTMPNGVGQVLADTAKQQLYTKMGVSDPGPTFEMEMLIVEPDAFAKLNVGDLGPMDGLPGSELLTGKKWMHIDRAKVKDTEGLPLKGDAADALGLKELLAGAQGVQVSGDRRYTGTVDVTKTQESMVSVHEDVIKALGDKAKAVPFIATLDSEGRLTELVLDVPVAGDNPAHQLKLSLSKYGTATVPAKPAAGEYVEAPDNVYDSLGG